MNFDIKTEQLGDGTSLISLAGEVDLYTAPEFKQQLLEVIGQGAKTVLVDLTDTTFIDSTTLGVLVGGVKRLRRTAANSCSSATTGTSRRSSRSPVSTASSRSSRPARMQSRSSGTAPRSSVRGLGAATLGLGLALALAGCGTGSMAEGGNASNGKTLFLNGAKLEEGEQPKPTCASCHTLAAAGAFGKAGPNLDDAFAFAHQAANKGDRFKENTIANVVLDQIRYPAENNIAPQYVMPADLVTGQDAIDVATYVASVAGKKPSADAG